MIDFGLLSVVGAVVASALVLGLAVLWVGRHP